MTDIARKVQAAYDRLVSDYARRHDHAMPETLIPFAERLAGHTSRNARVIDIGCGTGRDMAWFEARGVAVCGVDISLEMLRYAREKVRGNLAGSSVRAPQNRV